MQVGYPMVVSILLVLACQQGETFDIIIENGLIVDGSGHPAYVGDVAIRADTIAAVAPQLQGGSEVKIDATGLAVTPGFINMLSWATESLIEDGRAMSDIKQGVTLEVMGEGWSMGPLTDSMAIEMEKSQGDISYNVVWRTLGEYLRYLEKKGVSANIASFIGASTVRIHEIGYQNRAPTDDELERMKKLVADAMEEGAMGVSSALIYTPGFFAKTEELIQLAGVASAYDGMYITHMRSEGNKLLESVDEVISIASGARCRAEIYHLKAAGKSNWPKMDEVIRKINNAQQRGLSLGANMYTYIAGATGLDASMPPWVQEGGYDAWAERLQDPSIRKRVVREMGSDAQDWENLYHAAGSADNLLLVGFKNDNLKKYTGMTLAEVAELRGQTPESTAIDLVVQDGSRVGTVYFLMSEENIRQQLQLPYMTFGSDAGAPSAEGVFLKSSTHPRAYGNFARLLGKYVRDEQAIPLEEAIHKLTLLSAQKLKIDKRGLLASGYYADIVVFDPAAIRDLATFEEPHQYAVGVHHVWVNGEQVLKDGEHTGATPGRFIKGPGYRGE